LIAAVLSSAIVFGHMSMIFYWQLYR